MNLDRRLFLIGTGATAATALAPHTSQAESTIRPRTHETQKELPIIEAPKGTFGFSKIVYEQIANDKELTLTADTMRDACNAWEKYYRSEGGKKDIVRAVFRMLHDTDAEGVAIFSLLKEDCKKAGIDFNVLFLAIVESRYRAEVTSHAGARGHFQWMETTARHPRYKLIEKNADGSETDYRSNPLRAGRAMITYLRFFADTFFGGNTNKESIRLALLAYNGSFPHTYAIQAKRTNTTISGYMQFMQHSARSALSQLNTPKTYVIQPGDTLDALARRHHVPVAALARETGKSGVLQIGEKITIPPPFERTLHEPPHAAPIHTVKRGDTLTKITAKHRLSIEQLIAFNTDKQLTVNTTLHPGDKIRIGDAVSPGAHHDSERTHSAYKAQRGTKALAHHIENMDYLAKVEALISVLHDKTYIQHPLLAES